jgi:hypothetical protein
MTSKRDWLITILGAQQQQDMSWVFHNGITRWYNEAGQLHREDGPAVILPDGGVEWWFNGTHISFSLWCRRLIITDEQKLLLRLQYD